MTQTSNPPESQLPKQSEASDLIQQLRNLLDSGAKRIASDSSEEVARKVNQLAVCFINEQDNSIALQCVALVGIAAAKGSKEAEKRKPKLTRWMASAPPSLQILETDGERRAATKLLSSIKTGWVPDYAFREGIALASSVQLVTDLIKWAYASVETGAEFATALAGIFHASSAATAERNELIFKISLKCLGEARVAAGSGFSDAFLMLATALAEHCKAVSAPPKSAAAFQTLGLAIADVVSSQEPGLLFEVGFQKALTELSTIGNGWAKTAMKTLMAIGGRMLSIAFLNARIHSEPEGVDFAAIAGSARKTLPLEKAAKKFSSQRHLINDVLQPKSRDTNDAMATLPADPQLYEQVAALIVAWDALRATHLDEAVSKEVQLQIDAIAANSSLDRIGQIGESEPYRPLQHHLMISVDSPPDAVRIEVPGVRSLRPDGTFRVLIKALATPLNRGR